MLKKENIEEVEVKISNELDGWVRLDKIIEDFYFKQDCKFKVSNCLPLNLIRVTTPIGAESITFVIDVDSKDILKFDVHLQRKRISSNYLDEVLRLRTKVHQFILQNYRKIEEYAEVYNQMINLKIQKEKKHG